jgi:hypothetical protein
VSLVRLETGELYTAKLIRGNEKAVLDFTFPKMIIANTVEFSSVDDERR